MSSPSAYYRVARALFGALVLISLVLVALRVWGFRAAQSWMEARGVQTTSISISGPWQLELKGVTLLRGEAALEAASIHLRFDPSPYPILLEVHAYDLRLLGAGGLISGPDSSSAPSAPSGSSDPSEALRAALTRLDSIQANLPRLIDGLAALRPYMGADLRVHLLGLAAGSAPFHPLNLSAILPLDPQSPIMGSLSYGASDGHMDINISPRGLEWSLETTDMLLPQTHLSIGDGDLIIDEDIEVELSLSGGPTRIEGRWAVRASELHINHPFISEKPLGPLNLEIGGEGHLDRLLGRLTLRPLNGRLSQVPFEGSVEAALTGELEVTLSLGKEARGESLLSSIPEGAAPALRGLKVEGPISLSARLWGDLAHPQSLRLEVDGDGRGLRLLEGNLGSQLGAYPLEGHVHAPVDANGRSHVRILSRRSPGWTPMHQISAGLINAVILAEDGYFFEHRGVDPRAIAAAFEANVMGGQGLRGGSTLTQQLAKNLFLSPRRTLMRKLQEVALAWELERRLTKAQILETYLNIIEWGPGIYGIAEAAEHYFAARPEGLTLKQSAFLASIIPGPRVYYVYYLRGGLSPRWDGRVGEILSQMAILGHISWNEARRAQGEELSFAPPPAPLIEQSEGENPWR